MLPIHGRGISRQPGKRFSINVVTGCARGYPPTGVIWRASASLRQIQLKILGYCIVQILRFRRAPARLQMSKERCLHFRLRWKVNGIGQTSRFQLAIRLTLRGPSRSAPFLAPLRRYCPLPSPPLSRRATPGLGGRRCVSLPYFGPKKPPAKLHHAWASLRDRQGVCWGRPRHDSPVF
jgi:hypothetical protein